MVQYSPRPLTEEVNTPKRSLVLQLLLLLGVLTAILVLIYMLLGFGVDLLARYIPAGVERSVGELFSPGLCQNPDPDKTARVQSLLGELTPFLEEDDKRLDYQVCVEQSADVNAIALPGGRIVFFTGLLDLMESDSEVLFVLAHELGHFHHRDHLRKMGRGLLLLALSVSMLGQDNGITGLAMDLCLGVENAYSRGQERDADLYALDLLHRVTESTRGAVGFMEKLVRMEKHGKLLYYFATHPHPEDRLEYLREEIAARGWR